jgi:subtilisin-like proprotein convertase family protein
MKKNIFFLLLIVSTCIQAQVYNGTGGGLPDVSTSDFNLNISTLSPSTLNASHGLKKVCLDINHTYVSDLNISLISPSGNVIVLIGNIGGGGQNFTSTCLVDASSDLIGAGTAPFTGIYKPTEDLGNINDGTSGNGIWTLSIRDDAAADTGILFNWSLEFDTGATAPFLLTSSNLPIVIINTFGQSIADDPKINCNMKIINNPGGARNNISDTPEYDAEIGIEIRGNYSSSLPQKPYAFTTQDISHNDSNVALVGMPAEHDWVLQSTYNDKTFLRNPMMFDLARDMGHYATRTKYCEVVINNQYKGIYFICEKIKRDANRVDIAKLDLDDNAGDSLTGGYIIKHDYLEAGWTSFWRDSNCDTRTLDYNYYYPSSTNITIPQATYIKEYVDSFEVALFGNNFTDTTWGYDRYISQKSFIDYFLINELALNNDGFKKSLFMHKDKNGKLKAGPIWDFDWALKFAPWEDSLMSGWKYSLDPCGEDVLFIPWYKRLLQDTTFENATYCRWQELRNARIIDQNTFFNTIDTNRIYLDEAQNRHYNKWRILGLDSGSPEVYPIPTSYDEELNRYKYFFDKRIQWIDSNLTGHCYLAPVDTTQPEDTLSITYNESDNRLLNIYPNPTNNIAYIKLDNRYAIHKVTVLNLIGKQVYEEMINLYSNFYKLDMSEYATGSYIIQIEDLKGNKFIKKIFKE